VTATKNFTVIDPEKWELTEDKQDKINRTFDEQYLPAFKGSEKLDQLNTYNKENGTISLPSLSYDALFNGKGLMISDHVPIYLDLHLSEGTEVRLIFANNMSMIGARGIENTAEKEFWGILAAKSSDTLADKGEKAKKLQAMSAAMVPIIAETTYKITKLIVPDLEKVVHDNMKQLAKFLYDELKSEVKSVDKKWFASLKDREETFVKQVKSISESAGITAAHIDELMPIYLKYHGQFESMEAVGKKLKTISVADKALLKKLTNAKLCLDESEKRIGLSTGVKIQRAKSIDPDMFPLPDGDAEK